MKHVTQVTQKKPVRADAVQDMICKTADVLHGLLEAFGGSAPLVNYVYDKCDYPDGEDIIHY